MAGIAHFEDELRLRHTSPRGADRRGQDVHMGLGEHLRDVGEQTGAVECLDLDLDEVDSARLLTPGHVDHAFGFALE